MISECLSKVTNKWNKTKFLSVQLGKTLALTIVRIYALQLNLCLKVKELVRTFKRQKMSLSSYAWNLWKVYGNSFNLDLAKHNSSTHTKSNLRSQSKSFDFAYEGKVSKTSRGGGPSFLSGGTEHFQYL